MIQNTDKIADKLDSIATSVSKKIDDLRRDRLENTPKRQRQGMSRRIEARHLERVRDACTKIANARRHGTLPAELDGFNTKQAFLKALQTRTDHCNYYVLNDTGVYYDQSEAAVKLRNWLENNDTAEDRAAKEEQARREKIIKLENAVRFSNIEGFFPTPKEVVERMLDLAGIRAGRKVIEPSAGKGDIAEAIREREPLAKLYVLERSYTLREILTAKGFEFETNWRSNEDFLIYNGWADYVVMNPPFERGQDIDHIRHAYDRLSPGGRLVSVLCGGAMSRSDKKSVEFREWLNDRVAHVEKLPEGPFKNAFRSTGVSAYLVMLDK